MPSAVSRVPKPRRNRRRNNMATTPQPTSPIAIVSASAALSVVTITFDQPVVLTGTPNYTTDVAGAVVVSAALTSPTVLELTFDTSVAAATVLNIPYESPAVRNASGGFVSDSTFTL